jgi:hypothetical protein
MTFDWPDGGPLLDGVELDGGVLAKEEMNRQASPLVHVLVPSSQPEHPSTGPGPWPPSNAAHCTGYPARQE